MVGPETHHLPETTILSEDGVTLGLGSPFLVILVPSSCFQVPLYWPYMEAP